MSFIKRLTAVTLLLNAYPRPAGATSLTADQIRMCQEAATSVAQGIASAQIISGLGQVVMGAGVVLAGSGTDIWVKSTNADWRAGQIIGGVMIVAATPVAAAGDQVRLRFASHAEAVRAWGALNVSACAEAGAYE